MKEKKYMVFWCSCIQKSKQQKPFKVFGFLEE